MVNGVDWQNSVRNVLKPADSLSNIPCGRRDCGGAPTNEEFPLVKEGRNPSESQACDLRGRERCITTSHGKSGPAAESTIPRSSSPRREGHRGRPSGSAWTVPFVSSASTTHSAAMSGTGCGEG